MLLFGQEVRPGTRDDIAVYWTDGVERRTIVGCGYPDAGETLKRMLRRLGGGAGYYESLRAKLSDLDEPGGVITSAHGQQRMGLMRPYLALSLSGWRAFLGEHLRAPLDQWALPL